MTSACAACVGGTGPRTRRRWPRRAVRTGSNKTVVPLSSHVLVLCPHHVSVTVTAQRAGSAVAHWIERASRAVAAAFLPARTDNHCGEDIWAAGAGSRLSPSLVLEILVPVKTPSSAGR
jgi:hypothetical protein